MNSAIGDEQWTPSMRTESRAFRQLHYRILRNRITDGWQKNRLRFVVVAALSALFWGIVFYLFVGGFRLLRSTIVHEATCALAVHAVFNVFFVSLLIMIMLSSAIVFFSTAYRGRDVPTLLTQPIHPRSLALMKLREALLFSGWGFFLLGSPMLWAYGISANAPWYYFVAVIPFMLAFVAIPVGLGCIGCMVALRFAPRFRVHTTVAVGALLSLALAALAWSVMRESRSHRAFTLEWLEGTISRLQFAQQPVLPSWWLSSGLLEAAHPAARGLRASWHESLGFLAVLFSNSLVVYHAAGAAARKWYTTGYSEMVEFSRPEPQFRSGNIDQALTQILSPIAYPVRIMFLKDLRIFFRDILQWSQFAVFAGLLAIYFLNIRRLQAGPQFIDWLVLVGFLNIGVVGLLWATFTTRFVYPLLSLEGRRFWVLGTLPIDRSSILWSKFLFAIALGVIPCSLLILLSDLMLGISDLGNWLIVVHQVTSICLCLGLAGIAVGLGAWLPNLQETAPAKIATGYGGTLTLVLSVVYILVTVLATAIPVWGWSQGTNAWKAGWMMSRWVESFGTTTGLTAGIIVTMILGAIATWLPIRIGLRAFEQMEL